LSPKRLSGMLKRMRIAKGVTQRDLAKRARVTQGYVAQLEMGIRKNPSIETLKRLAKALGVPVTALLE
jgi:transcriptional regulator with XRE-family HTH domain